MKSEHEVLSELVAAHHQEHLLAFWDQLDARGRAGLAEQIRGVDFARVERLLREPDHHEDWGELGLGAQSAPAFRLNGKNPHGKKAAIERGRQALADGKVAVVLVAGGQGTRLGFDRPKGMFPIGPVSSASLFQIIFEKVAAIERHHGKLPRLYLMTSPATHADTLDYLAGHQYFGLPRDSVQVFCQGTMPAVDAASGKVLLAAPGELSLSPDGHGGMLAALAKAGALDDLTARGVERLFYMQVDNPLVNVCDTEFIGYHLLAGSEISTQVVRKRDPLERVGNVASIDGKVRIIEYSDLDEKAARRTAADGSLVLWAGNIAVHVLDVAFLRRVQSSDATRLPFHLARKKVPYLDARGELVEPAEANAIKFEQFIFDLLPASERSIVMEVDQRIAFAPVKNAAGSKTDTPEQAQEQMLALYRGWLEAAGAKVGEGVPVEISPRFAIDADEARSKLEPSATYTVPTYLR